MCLCVCVMARVIDRRFFPFQVPLLSAARGRAVRTHTKESDEHRESLFELNGTPVLDEL